MSCAGITAYIDGDNKQKDHILQTIGNTPLISLDRICGDRIPAKVYGKVESFNPGQSAKDRAALYMIEQAEKNGKIKPGATLIEATSGNTGFSIAMIAAVKGYKCILTLSDKAGPEKRALMTALGAKIVLCPKDAAPEDPESYYSQAEHLAATMLRPSPTASTCARTGTLTTVGLTTAALALKYGEKRRVKSRTTSAVQAPVVPFLELLAT